MLLSAMSVLVVAQSSSEIPEGLMNNPVFKRKRFQNMCRLNYTFSLLLNIFYLRCNFPRAKRSFRTDTGKVKSEKSVEEVARIHLIKRSIMN